jgi:hypothetical protein
MMDAMTRFAGLERNQKPGVLTEKIKISIPTDIWRYDADCRYSWKW